MTQPVEPACRPVGWEAKQRWWAQYERENHTAAQLRAWLSFVVPLRILELRQRGGPTHEDHERVRGYASAPGLFWGEDSSWGSDDAGHDNTLVCHGTEALLFPSDFPQEYVREWRIKLADALAVLSFCPGGARLFGLHFEAVP